MFGFEMSLTKLGLIHCRRENIKRTSFKSQDVSLKVEERLLLRVPCMAKNVLCNNDNVTNKDTKAITSDNNKLLGPGDAPPSNAGVREVEYLEAGLQESSGCSSNLLLLLVLRVGGWCQDPPLSEVFRFLLWLDTRLFYIIGNWFIILSLVDWYIMLCGWCLLS